MVHKTVAGVLPNEWKGTLIKNVCNVVRGSSPRPAGSPLFFDGDFLPWATVADLTNSEDMYLTTTKSMLTEAGAERTRITDPGTLMLTNSGATLGVPKISSIRCGANDGIAMLLKLNGIATEFAYYYLSSKTQYFREVIAPGVGQPNLNTDLIGDLPIPVPPIPEQKKIAQILSTWDKAISTTEQLLANSQQQKKALMQQLLTGKKRLLDKNGVRFSGEWKDVEIGKVLKEVKRPVDWDDNVEYKLLSVKRRSEGVVLREMLKGSEILTKKMNVAHSGDFLISKMQIVHGAAGLVSDEFDGFHVSDSYLSLIPKDERKLDIHFFAWFSKQKLMYHKAFLCSYGVHIEKMTFNFKLFLKEKIKLPVSIEEQQKIADVLSSAEQQISALQQKLDALKQEKKALMQQLLTGKRRVKINEKEVA